MIVIFDITEDDQYGHGRGTLPDNTIICDDGDVMLKFGDVAIRMSYGQFDTIIDGCVAWRESVPAEDQRVLGGEE